MKTELSVTLLTHTPEPEKMVAAAARLCYSSHDAATLMQGLSPDQETDFIKKLMELGHDSPLEHVSFTFSVEGVSRSLTHQLVRHRIASYSQKSQRYVQEGGFLYVVPEEIQNDPTAADIFHESMAAQQKAYDRLVERLTMIHIEREQKEAGARVLSKKTRAAAEKKALEDARYVLPNACETKIVLTMNARTLLHFFTLRCCNRAQTEIRIMATEMMKQVLPKAPHIFAAAGPACVKGECPEGLMTCGSQKDVVRAFREIREGTI